MDKFDIASRNTSEIVTEEELRALLGGEGKPCVYCGYEPSGKIHFGHLLTAKKLVDFQAVGAKVKVLLADLHAFLNHKGTLEEIRKTAEYNKRCFVAIGLDASKTEFILGSSFQLSEDFWLDVLHMAAATTLSRARRSMAEIARQLENPDVAQVLYPLMQVVDIAHLHADIAVGGGDQRKVHMIAREKLPLLGYQKPVCVHLPLLHGLDGGAKMSSTKGNFVAVDDPPEVIEKKIKDAFCPPKVVDDNPILEYARYVVLPSAPLKVKRPQKYGGDLEVKSWNELRKLYEAGEIHPADLKPALAESLVSILAPMRKYLEKHAQDD